MPNYDSAGCLAAGAEFNGSCVHLWIKGWDIEGFGNERKRFGRDEFQLSECTCVRRYWGEGFHKVAKDCSLIEFDFEIGFGLGDLDDEWGGFSISELGENRTHVFGPGTFALGETFLDHFFSWVFGPVGNPDFMLACYCAILGVIVFDSVLSFSINLGPAWSAFFWLEIQEDIRVGISFAGNFARDGDNFWAIFGTTCKSEQT